MTRPASHRGIELVRCCARCLFGLIPEYKDHRLCFHGDKIEVTPSCLREHWSEVVLDGENVGLLEGDAYDEVWGGRVVDDEDVCDEFEERQT